jgi:subtilisin family serine protease
MILAASSLEEQMIRKVKAGTLVFATLLAGSLGPARADAAAPSGGVGMTSMAGEASVTVTLITGDRVLVHPVRGGQPEYTMQPAKGREGTPVLRRTEAGDTYMIPADAAPLVAAGRVDRRLFNVTKLVEFGYDDRSRAEMPLIVTYTDAAPAAAAGRSRVAATGARVTRGLKSINGEAVDVLKSAASGFWQSTAAAGGAAHALPSGVAKLWLDGRVRATLDQSVAQVGAPAAWQAGHRGQGVTVAVLDSGIDDEHPDFAGAVAAQQDFTGSEFGADDRFGHGTHVAGIVTGSGAAAGGKYQGVAPDAKLLDGKVLADQGFGEDSWIIAGMEWAVAQGADIINMSLGSEFPLPTGNPMDIAVNRLSAESGVLFVIAAGNIGPGDRSISSPGTADAALTVGAVDRDNSLADFSSRGPRLGDLAIKPDMTAPGVNIAAALAADSTFAANLPAVDGAYVRINGTSMATPHVAGAAAILAAQHPGWKAAELKAALMGSAAPYAANTVFEQGAGRLDIPRAINQPVYATPASVSHGLIQWPHHDDEPISTTLTYHNDGAAPVTVTLGVDVRDPAGNAAPAGMFTVSPAQLTIPAGSSATATLVTDTTVTGPDGRYGGAVTATSGQTSIRTPVGLDREAESYDVAMSFIDRTGKLTDSYAAVLIDLSRPESYGGYDPSGRVSFRIPKGTYHLEAVVGSPGEERSTFAMTVEPEFRITGSTLIVIDARKAQPVGFHLDRKEARAVVAEMGFRREFPFGTLVSELAGQLDQLLVAPSKTSTARDKFEYSLRAHYARPSGTDQFRHSPYLYHVHRSETGRVPSDLFQRVRDNDLHEVRTEIAGTAPDQIVSKDTFVETTAPRTITEFYTPGPGFRSAFYVLRSFDTFDMVAEFHSAQVSYPRKGKSTKRWNLGVFSPTFPYDPPQFDTFVGRRGDTMQMFLLPFGDHATNTWGQVYGGREQLSIRLDGRLIGEVSQLGAVVEGMPAKTSTYELSMNVDQEQLRVSTGISSKWTFRAAAGAAGEQELVPMPLMNVRFAPDLDEHNRARAGRSFSFPVYVQRQAGPEYGHLRTLNLQVSYDDGRTWRPVSVRGDGLHRTATVHHPHGDGFVSLKAVAEDSLGNKVEQTVIRAYALKG